MGVRVEESRVLWSPWAAGAVQRAQEETVECMDRAEGGRLDCGTGNSGEDVVAEADEAQEITADADEVEYLVDSLFTVLDGYQQPCDGSMVGATTLLPGGALREAICALKDVLCVEYTVNAETLVSDVVAQLRRLVGDIVEQTSMPGKGILR